MNRYASAGTRIYFIGFEVFKYRPATLVPLTCKTHLFNFSGQKATSFIVVKTPLFQTFKIMTSPRPLITTFTVELRDKLQRNAPNGKTILYTLYNETNSILYTLYNETKINVM